MADEADELLVESKSAFARRTNVDPSRVTQWIAEGKIGPNALVGIGRNSEIRVALALSQLRQRLDIDKRMATGLHTRLRAPVEPDRATPPVDSTPLDPVDEQIKRARLAAIEFDNRRKAEDEAIRAGRLTDAAAARAAIGRAVGQVVTGFEGALPTLAALLAAKFQIQQRDAVHLLRGWSRETRAALAAQARRDLLAVPELIEMQIDDDPPEPAK